MLLFSLDTYVSRKIYRMICWRPYSESVFYPMLQVKTIALSNCSALLTPADECMLNCILFLVEYALPSFSVSLLLPFIFYVITKVMYSWMPLKACFVLITLNRFPVSICKKKKKKVIIVEYLLFTNVFLEKSLEGFCCCGMIHQPRK